MSAGLVTFTEEILNGKLHFLCSVTNQRKYELHLNMYLEIKKVYCSE